MITFENINKRYGKLKVLKGIHLTFEDHKITALLGPNGSGKTTLIKSLLGMVIPDKGIVQIEGKSIAKKWKYKNQLGYLPQIANFPNNTTVKELIAMIQSFRDTPCNPKELIELFELKPHLKKTLGSLSGGTKQKVNIVLAFMTDTPYLILDEPTSGLDPIALISLKKLILRKKKEGKSIIITSHILDFVEELSDEIIFILEGKVYFKGTVSQLLRHTNQTEFEYAIASLLKNNQDA